MNLILLKPGEVDPSGRARLAGERARHILEVLKAGPGQALRIGLLDGPLGSGTVESTGEQGIVLQCVFEGEPPPRPRIDLLLAMPRPKVMKRLWAQLAAVGVGRIVLVNAAKVERCYFDSHVVDPSFYVPLLVEGLQQARCTRLPEVMVRPRFKPFVEDELDALFAGATRLVADPSGTRPLPEAGATGGRAVLAVGPEGGWTPYELEHLAERGFRFVGMGPRILRTDTACIALLSMLADRMGGG